MPGDYSRKIFDSKKHYSGVLMQQGRVQLDADWNEQLDIELYHDRTETTDVIGLCGVPKGSDAFKISVSGAYLSIGAGHIYVDGLLCELDQTASYTNQPYYLDPEFVKPVSSPPSSPPKGGQLALSDGAYLVYLDAWEREITAHDDSLLRERALGGPDTTTRLQTVWQVRILPVSAKNASPPSSPPGGPICKMSFPEYDQRTAPATGKMNARTQADPQTEPCSLPPTAGYFGLENQLYRVEVHKGGDRNSATFKWSRENASVETLIKNISGNAITVEDLGRDDVLGFAGGQWVEIVDEQSTLDSKPRSLFQIDHPDPTNIQVILKTVPSGLGTLTNPKLRRWDQTGSGASTDGIKMSSAQWIGLENGVEVRFLDGTYNSGDYWLIPARTQGNEIEWPPFEVPNTNPTPQFPAGVRHNFCRLAVIQVAGGVILNPPEDCRKPFPPLTHICADDVCYDNSKCGLPNTQTVQDALDRLCAERDLRRHNKYLHGWGIVCGLQVSCGPDTGNLRRNVTVKPGYAIDCEGNDVVLDAPIQVDVIGQALLLSSPPSSPVSSPPGLKDGEYCLVLGSDGQKVRIVVEPFTPPAKTTMSSLLDGTLLLDFYNDCVKTLVDFFSNEFSSADSGVTVTPAQKRLSTALNLAVELSDTQNGPFVFLSGDKGKSGADFEDTIIRQFYADLLQKLKSHTFCAMFENARQLPDYPYSGTGIATIFSKGKMTRFRVSPSGKLGYSLGDANNINVFDLQQNTLIDQLQFPGGPSALVQDVAFSSDGTKVFAVATLGTTTSLFATATLTGSTHKWGTPSTMAGVQLVTLGTNAAVSGHVYAIGLGKGMYDINPDSVAPVPAPAYPFNALGPLDTSNRGVAFAIGRTDTSGTKSFNSVFRLPLVTPPPPPSQWGTFSLPASNDSVDNGNHEIVITPDGAQPTRLFAVSKADGASTKSLVIFDPNNVATFTPVVVDLGEDTSIKLAYNSATNLLMIAYEDSYRIALLDPAKNALVAGYRHPVQIFPSSVAMHSASAKVYVLNSGSNTINSIPAARLSPSAGLPLQPLVDYRAGVLNAFADLLGGTIEYLKDCFCEHLLVNCPTCDENDKLYLACVSVKQGQVYNVCNFSHRKYVKTFPTVGYWLSMIPIAPLIKKAFEEMCCTALPNVFAQFKAPQPQVAQGGVVAGISSGQVRSAITFVRNANFKDGVSNLGAKLAPTTKLVTDFVGKSVSGIFAPQAGVAKASAVLSQPADVATQNLRANGVTVDKVVQYDPQTAGQNLIQYTTAPANLQPGQKVTLVMKDEKVLFYTVSEPPSPALQDLGSRVDATQADLAQTKSDIAQTKSALTQTTADLAQTKATITQTAQLSNDVVTLKTQLTQLQTTHAQELATRDAQIADLKTQVTSLTAAQETVKTLQTQLEAINKRLPPITGPNK